MSRCYGLIASLGVVASTVFGCATSGATRSDDAATLMTEGRSINLREEEVSPPTGPGVGFSLAASATTPERRFVTVRPRSGEAYPGILEAPLGGAGPWRRIMLSDAGLPGYGWEFVGPVGPTNALFAVLDSDADTPAYELVILGSPDYGAAWLERGRLRKPDAKARVESVAIDVFGNGRITLRLEWADDLEAKVGKYHYDTKDGGQTFAPPIYEP